MSKVVFFDRDGTLNEFCAGPENRGPRVCSELVLNSNARQAVDVLVQKGYLTCVVTNQPDISRGLLSEVENDCIEKIFLSQLPNLDGYLVCPHDNLDNCHCRKPSPGMLLDYMQTNSAIPQNCWIIGDMWTDILAGKSAGVKTILIQHQKSFTQTSQGISPEHLKPDFEVDNLLAAVEIITRFSAS